MLETLSQAPSRTTPPAASRRCRVAVIWIDWYAYHVARFVGMATEATLAGAVEGVELVGGIGVHAGLKFREALPAGLPVTTLFPDQSWAEAGQWAIARALWSKLAELDPEVVLVPGYYTLPGLAAALWARLHRRTSVLMTESTREDHPRSALRERVKSLLVRALFDWAVTGGRRHASYLAALGFPAERVRGFYDVVDNDRLYHQAEQMRRQGSAAAPLESRYFLYVGRLAPEKNLAGLLQAYVAYRETGGRWPLVLVGGGPEEAILRQQAASSGYGGDIHFAGHTGSAGLPRYYAFAGCFVLPSTREPWGLVVNEAMACGLPVLVSQRCGCAEDLVAHGSNGFVFDPADPAALAAEMTAIETLNEEQWTRMSSQSLLRVREYSPEKFGAQIASIANTPRVD